MVDDSRSISKTSFQVRIMTRSMFACRLSGFQISIAIFFALALLSVCSRLMIRVATRKSLLLDDYLVILAAIALCVATGILFKMLDMTYLVQALNQDFVTSSASEADSPRSFMQWSQIYYPLMWLVIFLIKFAFLAFFYRLIWNRSRWLTIYFWGITALIAGFWVFMCLSVVITCDGRSSKHTGIAYLTIRLSSGSEVFAYHRGRVR